MHHARPLFALPMCVAPFRKRLGVALWVHDPEAEALHATLLAAGALVVRPPFDGPFGTTFAFQDLDGYLVTVHDRATRG